MIVDGKNLELNRSAASVFAQAAQDPKSAVELYAKCIREVNYVREEREESEYRDWEDRQKENFRDPRFLQGLMIQLRYLALSCEAAEGKDLKELFPQILTYVDSLSQMSELPTQQTLQGVQGSIFAKAYRVDDLLGKNSDNWEMVPLNVPGIYEKAVLPYLRKTDPGNLMVAWDRRIAQETQMARFYAAIEEKGSNRDQRRDSENQTRQLQQGRMGNVVRAYDEVTFEEETLPKLHWNRLRDMALYVDASQGVAGMLAIVREQTDHPLISDLLDDLNVVVEEIANRSEAPIEPIPAVSGTTPSASGVGTGTATTPSPTSTTTTTSPTFTTDKPAGLE